MSPTSVPSIGREQEFDGAALCRAVIERATTAAKEASPQEQHHQYQWRLPTPFLTAQIKQLSEAECSAVLGALAGSKERTLFLVAGEQAMRRDVFLAVIGRLRLITVEDAIHVFSIYAQRHVITWNCAGLKTLLKTMERAEPGFYSGSQRLQDAYRAMLAATGGNLNSSRVESADMTRRLQGLLGLAVQAAPQGNPSRNDGRHRSDFDGSQLLNDPVVDEYVTTIELAAKELREWVHAVTATDPDFHATAVLKWCEAFKGKQLERKAADSYPGVPLTCYEFLSPPPPRWLRDLQEACDAAGRAELVHAAKFNRGTLRFIARPDYRSYDLRWLEEQRQVVREVDKFGPVHDWSRADVVERASLLLERGGNPGGLFDLLWQARTATPTKRWRNLAAELVASPEGPAVLRKISAWLALIPTIGPTSSHEAFRLCRAFASFCRAVHRQTDEYSAPRAAALINLSSDAGHSGYFTWGSQTGSVGEEHPTLLSEENERVLRGAVWLLALEPASVGALQTTALALLEKAPRGYGGVAYRSLLGINACIWSLGQIATAESVTALGRIRLKLRDERLSKQIAKAMAEAASRAGLTIEELEEVAVPTYDLDLGGTRRVELAGHAATLTIESSTDVSVAIHRPDGKPAKSVPAAIKADAEAKTALKAMQASAKEIANALPVHRLRLERSWLTGRAWTGEEFRERLLRHPLMGWLASRLIWSIKPPGGEARATFFLDRMPVDFEGRALSALADDDTVALWHPMASTPEVVRAWRTFLMRHRITQPIKQAYREVYALTDAERQAETYSNRFAGHIVRQHQSATLARLRGWSCRLRIWADVPNDDPTHLKVPAAGIAAEYWTEGAGGDEPEVTDSQAYVFLKTDQIRFRRLTDDGDWRRDGGRQLRLGPYVSVTDVPAIVFSEVMRDIDLFVGVASIGHDPTWIDAGADARHPNQWRRDDATAYWHNFNAAELAESAKMRRAFLAELLPKLVIGPQCSLDDRFLMIRGTLGSYRLHIGSGNVFMEPDNRYVCIMQKGDVVAANGETIFLPFEGDRLLSVILSKAFLLAGDSAITDPTILRQIR